MGATYLPESGVTAPLRRVHDDEARDQEEYVHSDVTLGEKGEAEVSAGDRRPQVRREVVESYEERGNSPEDLEGVDDLGGFRHQCADRGFVSGHGQFVSFVRGGQKAPLC